VPNHLAREEADVTTPLADDGEEMTQLVDADFPRVDLVGKGANGIPRFLIAKADGLLMCCICYERIPADEAWRDDNDDRWDMCQSCGEQQGENRG
jgi:hypothetical protein